MIQAPPNYVITINGATKPPNVRVDQWPAVMYLFQRLLSGEMVAEEELEHFGFRVFVEEDCDQGAD